MSRNRGEISIVVMMFIVLAAALATINQKDKSRIIQAREIRWAEEDYEKAMSDTNRLPNCNIPIPSKDCTLPCVLGEMIYADNPLSVTNTRPCPQCFNKYGFSSVKLRENKWPGGEATIPETR